MQVTKVSYKLDPKLEAALKNDADASCWICKGTGLRRWETSRYGLPRAVICRCVKRRHRQIEAQLKQVKQDGEAKLEERRQAPEDGKETP